MTAEHERADSTGPGLGGRWPRLAIDAQTTAAIKRVSPILADTEEEAEAERRLPQRAIDELIDSGLFRLSLPVELGGREATLLEELEVNEAVARVSGSAVWNLAVGNFHTMLGAVYLCDEVVTEMFGGDGRSFICAGQVAPMGTYREVNGGMRVTGRYSWGSGIAHAGWVIGGCVAEGEPRDMMAMRVFVRPKEVSNVLDNWNVVGLAGSGSFDYELDDVFVPEGSWLDFAAPVPQRGGARYRLPPLVQGSPGMVGIMLGMAERAVDLCLANAVGQRRTMAPVNTADRPSFQYEMAQAYCRLSAARAWASSMFEKIDAELSREVPDLPDLATVMAMGTHVGDVAVDCATLAFRFGGGSTVRLQNPIQRILRDLLVARQHRHVANDNYDALGAALVAPVDS